MNNKRPITACIKNGSNFISILNRFHVVTLTEGPGLYYAKECAVSSDSSVCAVN